MNENGDVKDRVLKLEVSIDMLEAAVHRLSKDFHAMEKELNAIQRILNQIKWFAMGATMIYVGDTTGILKLLTMVGV